ncbi:uncharacterized protein LOC127095544 [Lathyrus oleraceus]|uniref:uncharacterized protein LOC127095544 n=1 Tax=Pisum sativum TaxID=3888 RepID=UPI0021CF039E|nr:uncharacterized protein LOC127095544 [Pisum sativum]
MAPYEALYGRRCRTPLCWYEVGENKILGSEFVQQTTDQVKLIRGKMKAAQDRQKSYSDKRRRPLEFEAGDHVFIRVTPRAGIARAIKTRKLTPRKYYPDPSHVIEPESVELRDNLEYEALPVKVLDHRIKELRGKQIPLVRVLLDDITGDSTWEREEDMRQKYPPMF